MHAFSDVMLNTPLGLEYKKGSLVPLKVSTTATLLFIAYTITFFITYVLAFPLPPSKVPVAHQASFVGRDTFCYLLPLPLSLGYYTAYSHKNQALSAAPSTESYNTIELLFIDYSYRS